MKDYLYLNHANSYAQSVGAETYHPMVSVVHFDELGAIAHTLNKMGDMYAFFVQDNFPADATYGMGGYDTSKGFEYPQHFSRFFKKHTGMQPSKYVTSIQKK